MRQMQKLRRPSYQRNQAGQQRSAAGAAGRRGRAVNVLVTIGWAIVAAVATWGLMLIHAHATIARINARWRAEVAHWQDETARAREYAAQLARPAAQPAAGHRQGQEYVVQAVPVLFRASCQVTEPGAAAVELTERT